ncbi:MAG: hypothetical protein AB2729_04380, partial [Candidatus Thiodiazotropha taylori]
MNRNKQRFNMSRTLCKSLIPILFSSYPLAAQASETSLITDQQMEEAERLFSGPVEEDYYRTDAVLVSATGSA